MVDIVVDRIFVTTLQFFCFSPLLSLYLIKNHTLTENCGGRIAARNPHSQQFLKHQKILARVPAHGPGYLIVCPRHTAGGKHPPLLTLEHKTQEIYP